MDIIKPLRANGSGWKFMGDIRAMLRSQYAVDQWFHAGQSLTALSAVEVASDGPGSVDKGPEYHISISRFNPQTGIPERCSAEQAQWVLQQFGLDGWEEDNHAPNGKVRNFWRPVAEPMIGIACPCKDTEAVIIEGDYEHRPLK